MDLPKSRILIRNGVVQSINEWVLWNGTPANTLTIERTKNDFSSTIGDPEHGGRTRSATELSDVLGGLHQNVREKYVNLFNLQNPTVEQVQQFFPTYLVEVQ